MKKSTTVIKTKRLILTPMSDAETEARIQSADSEELRAAYGEMLAGCRADPEHRVWYSPWKMCLKEDGCCVGDLCFKGPAKNQAVEIGYGVSPDYEGKGYTTEAVQAMAQWAFSQEGVTFVEAETEPGNKASQRVLEKCGFAPDGEGKEGPRFVLEAPLTKWFSIYMLFGLSIGLSLGTSLGNSATGMCLGMSVGLCIGFALDASAKKEREKLRQQRQESRQSI